MTDPLPLVEQVLHAIAAEPDGLSRSTLCRMFEDRTHHSVSKAVTRLATWGMVHGVSRGRFRVTDKGREVIDGTLKIKRTSASIRHVPPPPPPPAWIHPIRARALGLTR